MSIQLTQSRTYIQRKWENARCHYCRDVRILQSLGSQQNPICPAPKSISISGAVNHRHCKVVAYISIRSREPLPLECGCMYVYIYSTRVCNCDHRNQATKNANSNVHQNKLTYVLFVQSQHNNVSYILPKSISIRSREPSPLECGCI